MDLYLIFLPIVLTINFIVTYFRNIPIDHKEIKIRRKLYSKTLEQGLHFVIIGLERIITVPKDFHD